MKKKLGFTLVEVLAVIVILAIISAIIVPIVLNLIEKSKKNTASISALGYVDAIDKKVSMSSMLDNNIYQDKQYGFDEIDVDVNGERPTAGIYVLSNGAITNATFCINGYTVTYQDYKAVTGSKCRAEDMKLSGSLKVSKNSTFLTFLSEDSVQIIENKSNGEVTCSSSNTLVATCEMDGSDVIIKSGETRGQSTITLTSHGDSKYRDASAAILVSTAPGLLSVTANDYTGTFDGNAHGITVEASGAMIKYGTVDGVFDLDASPTYTDVGTYTVYYQVTRRGYTTVTGNKTVTINKANGMVALESSSGSMRFNEEKEVNITSSTGELSVSGFDSTVVSAEIRDGKLVLNGLKVGSTTVTVTSASTNNYNEASTTYKVSVVKANNALALSSNSGTVTYPGNTTFTVTENTSGGSLSCESSNTSAATCSVSGNTITVNSGTTQANSVNITVKSAATSNYNEASAVYVVKNNLGTLSVTANAYSGRFDGDAHGITVTSSGATIKYGTTSGTYNLSSSPTYTNVGTYTVYYQVTKAGYKTVTGSKTVTILDLTAAFVKYTNNGQTTVESALDDLFTKFPQ